MNINVLQCPSPNHGPRPDGAAVDMLILHYTGMESASAALERLCDPVARVSAHYMIDEDGTLWQMVDEDRRAWHAGVAFWAGDTDINDRSIGIELVNPGHDRGYRAFPEIQMAVLVELARAIVKRHEIPAHRVLGHSDISPDRKQDPGELFDWPRLARAGIGLWPKDAAPTDADLEDRLGRAQTLLTRFGYRTGNGGELDDDTRHALVAFQRHFRPGRVDGQLDRECLAILDALIPLLP